MERIPSFKEILKIAFPLMIGGISESISAIVDTAFMGKLGTLAIDGMGMTNVFLMLIIMLGWSFSRSVQILVSQNYGAENYKNIGKIVFNAFILMMPIGLLIVLVLYFFNLFFLGFIIDNPAIKNIASEICKIRAFGFPIIMATLLISSFFTGIGKTKILIYSQGIAAISNIFLNYILVFGKLGLPAMGYRGSALATVLSEILCLAVLTYYVLSKKGLIEKYYLFYYRTVYRYYLKELFRLATPMIVQHLFSLGAWVYFFSLIEKMGEKELAVSLIVKQIFTALTIPSFCLATTSNTIVGQIVGSRKIDIIVPSIIKVIKINYAILISLAVFTYLFRFPIVGLFTTDIIVLKMISAPLIVLLLSYLFIPAGNVIFNSISALGNTRIPLIIETLVIISYLIFLYVFVTILNGNLLIAWVSEFEYWLALIIMGVAYFTIFDWKKKIIYLDKT